MVSYLCSLRTGVNIVINLAILIITSLMSTFTFTLIYTILIRTLFIWYFTWLISLARFTPVKSTETCYHKVWPTNMTNLWIETFVHLVPVRQYLHNSLILRLVFHLGFVRVQRIQNLMAVEKILTSEFNIIIITRHTKHWLAIAHKTRKT